MSESGRRVTEGAKIAVHQLAARLESLDLEWMECKRAAYCVDTKKAWLVCAAQTGRQCLEVSVMEAKSHRGLGFVCVLVRCAFAGAPS